MCEPKSILNNNWRC